MQNRYAGDVGDYIKLALLRALSQGRQLGIIWYLHPDEQHNDDGKHVAYLGEPKRWRGLDPDLFDALASVASGDRTVRQLQQCNVVQARCFDETVPNGSDSARSRSDARLSWFCSAKEAMLNCDLVFADPDNGLTDDQPARRFGRSFGKQIPLAEARALAEGRCAVVYHHNTRFRGGHDLEVDHWLNQLGDAIAVRANAFSCRTFFIINADAELVRHAEQFCRRWSDHRVWLHTKARGQFARVA